MEGTVEAVARAICEAAGKSVNKVQCVICQDRPCEMWKEFREEARAAIRVIKNKQKFEKE